VLPLATGVAAVVNVVATYVGISLYGIEGAAWAKVAAYVAGAAVLYGVVQRIYPLSYDWWRIGGSMAAAGVIFGVVTITQADTSLGTALRLAAIPAYGAALMVMGVISKQTLQTMKGLVKR
jgi:O-antigen/teichoic acid export membrane protein